MTKEKSFIEWPKNLSEEQAKACEEHEKGVFLDSLWEDFRISRHPAMLAEYVRAGGDIGDQETRNLIANLLETVKPKHTRAHSQQQVDFYIAIKKIMRKNPGISRNEAFRLFMGNADAASDELKTVQSNYAAGAKLVGDRKKAPDA
jgi:hypothetical protein